jgi:hypothetical protein
VPSPFLCQALFFLLPGSEAVVAAIIRTGPPQVAPHSDVYPAFILVHLNSKRRNNNGNLSLLPTLINELITDPWTSLNVYLHLITSLAAATIAIFFMELSQKETGQAICLPRFLFSQVIF